MAAPPRNHFDRTNVSVTQNRPFTGGFLRFGGRQGNRDHGGDVTNKFNRWLLFGSLMDQNFVDQRAGDFEGPHRTSHQKNSLLAGGLPP